MADNNQDISTVNDTGSVSYANDVIAKIAALAADEIDGVAGLAGGGLSEMWGKKNIAKGVKITIEESQVNIEMSITVTYGIKIHEVCKSVQDNIKKAIENMTGLKVVAVNINVVGISIEKPEKPAEKEKKDKQKE